MYNIVTEVIENNISISNIFSIDIILSIREIVHIGGIL